MSLLRSVIRGYLAESLLLEGPFEKMRNMGMPEPFAEWFLDFLPDYSKQHAHWYAAQFSSMMHQFKDHINQYKKAIKRGKKEPRLAKDMQALASIQFQKWKDAIGDTINDIEVIDKWAESANINLSKKKEVKLSIGDEVETIKFNFSSAIKAAKQHYNLQDGKIFMNLSGGWYWLDRESNYCSIESSLMGHCGRADDSDSTLFSLRDPSGMPHITAEILFDDDGTVIKQMKGKGNTTPDKKYHEMIYSLLKNKNLELKHYHATGRWGGDLRWGDIPEDVREEIAEVHEDTFDESQADDIETVLTRVEEEIMDAVNNFSHDFYDIWTDPSGWDTMDEEEAYVRVDVSFYVELPDDIEHALDSMTGTAPNWKRREHGYNDLVEDVFNKLSMHSIEDWAYEDGAIRGYMHDDDLSTIVSTREGGDNVNNIVNAIGYWADQKPSKDEFLNLLRNVLMQEGYLEGYNEWQVEELVDALSNFSVSIEDDPTDEDFNVITAEAKIANLSDVKDPDMRMKIKKLLSDPNVVKGFFDKLIGHFEPNLKQLMLPNIDVGPALPLTVPAGATLYHYSTDVELKVIYNQAEHDANIFVEFLEKMDNNIEVIEKILALTIQEALEEETPST